MLNLLIDIGNTNIKTAFSAGKRLYNIKKKGYSKSNFEISFRKALVFGNIKFDYTGVCCLNKKHKSAINKILKDKYSVKPFFAEYNVTLPLKLDYEKSIGNDRICSAVAASVKYKDKKNILVVDFGTATTYNLIVGKQFIGGLITPGIRTSLLSLNSEADLPLTEIKNIKHLISNKTRTNILSGIIHQSLFTTEGIINSLKKNYKDLFVISTGGLSELISGKTCLIDRNEKNLVLEGINILLNLNSTIH